MNLYYTGVCQLLDGNPTRVESGYYIKTDDERIVYADKVPSDVQLVTFQELEDALFEGCKYVINEFANSENNKDVYAFNLYADEHNSFYIYINTEDSFRNYVDRHYSSYSEKKKQEIKYNQGDFTYQLYPSDMGTSQQIIEECEEIASDLQYVDHLEDLSDEDIPVIVYEKRIFNDGFFHAALNAIKRLGTAFELDKLNKSKNFIHYAATGNDYVDFSLVMRKTIQPDLFYTCFPELEDKDKQFEIHLDHINSKSIKEILDFWEEALQGEFKKGSPYQYLKTEYQVFKNLEKLGDDLALECISRLSRVIESDLNNKMNINKIGIYLKALEFFEINEDLLSKISLIKQLIDNASFDAFLEEFIDNVQKDLNTIIERNTIKS
jgi:hypothetical protein